MSWLPSYQQRIVSAEEALKVVKSGDRVYVGGGCGVPESLLNALVARAPELRDVQTISILMMGPAPQAEPAVHGHLRHLAMFIGGNVRQAVNEGRADFMSIHLHEIPSLYRNGKVPIDVALIQVSPPDEHGFCSFGVEVGVTKPAAQAAKLVIAEVNDRMPRVLGDSFIHVGKLDYIVLTSRPLPDFTQGQRSLVHEQIGKHVASLIDDGCTLQTGIGGIPDAVLSYLHDRKDLGIHSELFSDGVVNLVEGGVINNERKTLHPGKIVAGFILGSQRLYAFVNNNPIVELHPTDYVNDPFVIAQNDKMISVNSALAVDLTGQVCADSMGQVFYSGTGGQVDFVRGAGRAKGGKPIIALPATAKEGKLSRIVPYLDQAAGVVTSRSDVHYVATEYGVVDLHGRPMRERCRLLISIAAPQFRAELERYAWQNHLLSD